VSARLAATSLVLVALVGGCNLVLGLDEPSERGAGGGGGTSGSESNGSVSSSSSGGGGGSAGGGQGGCPDERPAGPGLELLANGSFEQGIAGWANADLATFEVETETSFCGCQSARVVLSDDYQELRGFLPAPTAGTVHARVRIQASDLIDADLILRVDSSTVEPPVAFGADAFDDEGADGWRTAQGDWPYPAGSDAFFVVVFGNGTLGQEVLVDCASLTYEP
jgi:hypothetical protein